MLFMLIPWSLGLVARDGPAAHAHAVLVHRPSHRLLLAAPGLRVLVHAGAAPGGRQALQRPDGARSFLLFLILSAPLGLHHQVRPTPASTRAGSSSRRSSPSRCSSRACSRSSTSSPRWRAGPGARRAGAGRVVLPAAVGRPVAGRAAPRDADVLRGRHRRADQRLVQHEPGRAQHQHVVGHFHRRWAPRSRSPTWGSATGWSPPRGARALEPLAWRWPRPGCGSSGC